MKTLLLSLTILLGSQAFATSASENLKSIAQEIRRHCDDRMCRSGYEYRLVYNFGTDGALPAPIVRTLESIAKNQAQIWGDTILEGDYQSKGDTRLDQIKVVRRGNRVLAYRIVYSETARDPRGLGRIVEASWVHPDFRTSVTDDDQPATFKRNVR
jgi:hypothetical protein